MSARMVPAIGLIAAILAFIAGNRFVEERSSPKPFHKQTSVPIVTTTPSPTINPVPTSSPGKAVKGASTTSTSTVGALITCTGPDGKEFTTTEEECRKFNEAWGKPVNIPVPAFTLTPGPDPVITCNVHASCGGGSLQMKRSECDQTTCCQIGGKWYFYTSKGKCKKDQEDYWANYYKNLPTPAPWPTFGPLPTIQPYVPSTYRPLPAPTLSPEEVEAYYERKKRECQAQVVEEYKPVLISYGCPLPGEGGEGPSSACDALKYQAEKAMEKCDQLYP